MNSHVCFIVFYFHQNKFWAFKEMGRPRFKTPDIKGLKFFKMMGSGRKGFGIIPSWNTYTALLVADQEVDLNNSEWFKTYSYKSTSQLIISLNPVKTHGLWNGKNPFFPLAEVQNKEKPCAVLTRASVKPSQWWRFWWSVPSVSKTLSEDCKFSIGVGELPLIEQATLSLWPNIQAMTDWAYKQKAHQKAIKNTHKLKWYSEEMFTRFEVIDIKGTYKDLTAGALKKSLGL